MTTEQLEQLRDLIVQWRTEHHGWFNPEYDNGRESAYSACADALEEVLQTFNVDEES